MSALLLICITLICLPFLLGNFDTPGLLEKHMQNNFGTPPAAPPEEPPVEPLGRVPPES